MKRIFLLFTIFAVAALTVRAQYVITKETTQVVVSNPQGDDVVNINSQQDGRMTISVAGMEIILKESPSDECDRYERTKKNRRSIVYKRTGYQALVEVGINALFDVDYSLYEGMTLPGIGDDFMTLNNIKSLQWAFSVADMTVYLNKTRNLAFSMGIQAVFDNYTFSDRITLAKREGILIPEEVNISNFKKSKMSTFSIRVPLMFHVGGSRSMHFSAGFYGGVRLGSKTKVKRPIDKVRDPYMNPFYAGATARLGYREFYAFCNYGLTDLFKKDHGPATAPVTIGLGLGF